MPRVPTPPDDRAPLSNLFGWMGTICLLSILSVKLLRVGGVGVAGSVLLGVIPSVVGPAGLLFLLLSSGGALSRMTLSRLTLAVTGLALGLEFAQLIPRPGLVARIKYTFDWLDVWTSLGSVLLAYLIARWLLGRAR